VILPGYTRGVPEYYLTRWRTPVRRLSFPPELEDHLGWFDYERALRDAPVTRQEAASLAAECRGVLAAGHRLLLVVTSNTPPEIVAWLGEALQQQFGPPSLAYRQYPLRTFYIVAYGPSP